MEKYLVPGFLGVLNYKSGHLDTTDTKDCWLVMAIYLFGWKKQKSDINPVQFVSTNSHYKNMYEKRETLPLALSNSFFRDVCRFEPIVKKFAASPSFGPPGFGKADQVFYDEFGYNFDSFTQQGDWIRGNLALKKADDKIPDYNHFVNIYKKYRLDSEVFKDRYIGEWVYLVKRFGPLGISLVKDTGEYHFYVLYGYKEVKGIYSVFLRDTSDGGDITLSWKDFKENLQKVERQVDAFICWHVGDSLPEQI